MMVPTPSVAITELTLQLGDDEAVDDADQRAEREHDQDRERDGQLVVHDEAGHQHAVQARGVADREVELADDHGERQAAGDDHRERGLIEDIDEIVEGRKRVGREDREGDDHRREPDDRPVAGEDAERRLGRRATAGARTA